MQCLRLSIRGKPSLRPSLLYAVTCLAAFSVHDPASHGLRAGGAPKSARIPAESREYDGLTLEKWRERIKSLDFRSEDAVQAIPGLTAIVADREAPWFNRRQAAMTLGRIGKPAASSLPVLRDCLSEPQPVEGPHPTTWVASALGLFGPVAKDATPDLLKIAADRSRPVIQRVAGIEALSQIGPAHRQAIPALRDLLTDEDPIVQTAAAEGIAYLGPAAQVCVPTLTRLLRAGSPRMRFKSAQALAKMGPAAEIAIPAVVDALVFDDSPEVRDEAGNILAAIGPASLDPLRQLAGDSDAEVRWRAVRALGLMGQLARPARATLDAALEDPNETVRAEALSAHWAVFASLDNILPLAIELLQSTDRQQRIRAARFLVDLGPRVRRVLQQLKTVPEAPRTEGRRAAAQVIRALSDREIP